MYSKSRKSVLAYSIALALASASGAALAGTDCQNDKSHQMNMSGQDISEARQETQILTSYSLNSYLRANDLQVSVDEGKATLTGTVEEDVSKQLAHDIAHGVAGIDSVDNQIKVDSDYAAPARTSQDRSFGEVVDDASITATVKSKLLWSKNTEGLQINVDTSKGKVTLSGDAESKDAKALAATMAADTRGVVSVDNQLVVDSTKSASEVAKNDSGKEGFPDVSDGWITTKVTSTFMYSANVASNDIEVSTDQGVVTLTGKVDSDSERLQAIELAGNIRGVKSVNATGLTI
ncbi:MAG TPA: BON domain-containing protein [Xanthomonadales bacterium]|nr:BON domain-containing protein [Xanthomonadales bacterium]